MYNEQPESLSIDRHDEMQFYGTAITPSTASHVKRSFIRKEKTNNRKQDQERSGGRGFADASPPGDSGDDFFSSYDNGGDAHGLSKNKNNKSREQTRSPEWTR